MKLRGPISTIARDWDFRRLFVGVFVFVGATSSLAHASSRSELYLKQARKYYNSGRYYTSARYAFAAAESDPSLQPQAYSIATLGLVKAGLYNSASYFFIRTLQTGQSREIQRVLTTTEELIDRIGPDLLRGFLIKHTRLADYNMKNRSAFLYSAAKARLLRGDEGRAVQYLNAMNESSFLWPFALQLRGTAHAISGREGSALRDFGECAERAGDLASSIDLTHAGWKGFWKSKRKEEYEDLQARCQAGRARTYYQMNEYVKADRAYDEISKNTFVWTDILFEQAWNSFGRREYNRTLGKLVTYKNPSLKFVFNPEVDILRAQAYLALCQYVDVNRELNYFNRRYTKIGKNVKRFVERNANNLGAFYASGKKALRNPLHSRYKFYRLLNRFVRSPYFQSLVSSERALISEEAAIRRFGGSLQGAENSLSEGFSGFLQRVLAWRKDSIQFLGGAFVKNSLIDYHDSLISDFEKASFIKLEMLSKAKAQLVFKSRNSSRARGSVEPERRDDQYFWSFNGEFWNDEIGDYVFGLESKCDRS